MDIQKSSIWALITACCLFTIGCPAPPPVKPPDVKPVAKRSSRALDELEERPSQVQTRPSKKEEKVRVAALELLNPAQLPPQEVSYLSNLVRQATARLPEDRYSVITRENITAMLPPDRKLEDCIGECEVETGRLLGVQWLISGQVVKFGRSLRVSLNLHHSKSGELRGSEVVKGEQVEDLEVPITNATLRLMSRVDPSIEVPSASPGMLSLPSIEISPDQELEEEGGKVEVVVPSLSKMGLTSELKSIDLEALTLFDKAVKADQDKSMTPQERIELWKQVGERLPELRARAQQRVQEWESYIERQNAQLKKQLNQLDQRRRRLATQLNEVLEQKISFEDDLRQKQASCEETYEKLVKLVGLDVIDRQQKIRFTVEYARQCGAIGQALRRMSKYPYSDLLSEGLTQREKERFGEEATEMNEQIQAAERQFSSAYATYAERLMSNDEKIDSLIREHGIIRVTEASGSLKRGDRVRVKASVSQPRYQWGNVSPGEVGTFKELREDGRAIIDFPSQSDWMADPSEIEHASGSEAALRRGDKVRVKSSVREPEYGWGSVSPGEVGTFKELRDDGRAIIDFPSQSDWMADPSEIELSREGGGSFLQGDKVRVKRSVSEPKYKWGSVSPGEVGTFKELREDGRAIIDFPSQSDWMADPSELEHADSRMVSDGGQTDVWGRAVKQWRSGVTLQDGKKEYRKIPRPDVPQVGMKVVRGPDWKWDDQDGGTGKMGEIIRGLDEDLWVRVEWESGGSNSYRWGSEGAYDLEVVEKISTSSKTVSEMKRVELPSQTIPLLGDRLIRE